MQEALIPLSKEPGMEKNYFIALVLSMIVLMGYPFLIRKLNPPVPPTETAQTERKSAGEPQQAVSPRPVPQMAAGEKKETAAAPTIIPFSNALYDVRFSTLGATIVEMSYKGEKSKHLEHIPFFIGAPEQPGIFAVKILNESTDLSHSIFRLNKSNPAAGEFEFIFEKPGEYQVLKKYTLHAAEPLIKLDWSVQNFSSRERQIPVEMTYALYHEGSSHMPDHDVEAVAFQDKVISKNLGHVRKKGFVFSGNAAWTGLLKKYFAILVKPQSKTLSSESKADAQHIATTLRLEPVAAGPSQTVSQQFFIFAGPQRYEMLKDLNQDFEQILSKGFFGLFKIWLLIALKFLYQFTHNFGWAIILLTLALKGLFTPLTHMSYESMRKMQAIQPKMKSIQERYKNDPQKMQREVMELYRRNKVNPMGGCLPMVAQIPIFIAFYQVLNETIELKGASFIFWIHDLAEADKLFMLPFSIPFLGDSFHLLPILMAGSMFWQQRLTPQMGSTPEQTKVMQLMPIMMGFIFYKLPSGLVLYWLVNNLLTIFHQLVIKRMGAVILHHEDQ